MACCFEWKNRGNTGQSILENASVRGGVDVPSGKRTMKVFGAGNSGFLWLCSKFASSAQHHREKDHGCSNRSHPQRDKSVSGWHVVWEPMTLGVDAQFTRKNGVCWCYVRNGILPGVFYQFTTAAHLAGTTFRASRTSRSRTNSSFLLQMHWLTTCLR